MKVTQKSTWMVWNRVGSSPLMRRCFLITLSRPNQAISALLIFFYSERKNCVIWTLVLCFMFSSNFLCQNSAIIHNPRTRFPLYAEWFDVSVLRTNFTPIPNTQLCPWVPPSVPSTSGFIKRSPSIRFKLTPKWICVMPLLIFFDSAQWFVVLQITSSSMSFDTF